jgi:hypothetical protein
MNNLFTSNKFIIYASLKEEEKKQLQTFPLSFLFSLLACKKKKLYIRLILNKFLTKQQKKIITTFQLKKKKNLYLLNDEEEEEKNKKNTKTKHFLSNI